MNEIEQKKLMDLRAAYLTIAEEEHKNDPEILAIQEKMKDLRAEYVAYLVTHIPLEYRTK